MATKSPLSGRGVPKPKNQGGHGKAPVQGVKMSNMPSGVKKPANSDLIPSKQPSGTHGAKKSF